MTKKELLNNLWGFTPEQIAEAVRNGVVTEYELKTQAHGQYTPLLRRKVGTLLKEPVPAPAQPAPTQPVPVQPVPVQPAPAPAPQPVFINTPVEKPAPRPFAESTVMEQAPAYGAVPPPFPAQMPVYPQPEPAPPAFVPAPEPGYNGTPSRNKDERSGFAALFSFKGRIGRGQYFLSCVVYSVVMGLMSAVAGALAATDSPGLAPLILLVVVPLYWFFLAQSVKRSHDLGHSGWWILIPFYGLWLLLAPGQKFPNRFGPAL